MLALENASLLEVLAGLLNCARLLNLFGVQTASVNAVTPLKFAPVPVMSEDEDDLRSISSSIEELLRSRHRSVEQTSLDQFDMAEQLAKVHKEELEWDLNSSPPLRKAGRSNGGTNGKGKRKSSMF